MCNVVNAQDLPSYNSAVSDLPLATSPFHSVRQRFMLARSLASPRTLPIQSRSASSSSGTKKEESKERMVSKVAPLVVM
jgi:hypothetical protein